MKAVQSLWKKHHFLIAHLLIAGFSFILLVFIASSMWIGQSVREHCEEAVKKYGDNCVSALEQTVLNENEPYGERNSAIWALGQLGDKKALLTLVPLYTGVVPEREPWNGTLSQYELKKAIELLESGVNITAFVWR